MPAAAVIPAPYIKVAVVEKLVVELRARGCRAAWQPLRVTAQLAVRYRAAGQGTTPCVDDPDSVHMEKTFLETSLSGGG